MFKIKIQKCVPILFDKKKLNSFFLLIRYPLLESDLINIYPSYI